MKKLCGLIFLGILAIGCQKSDVVESEFTGNEATYSLQQGSQYNVSGTITFKERKDGAVTGSITLTGTDGDVSLPVHLHLGNITTPAADIALLMTPVAGKTGTSITTFSKLSDESTITFDQLKALDACVKIHLGDTGADRDVILAAGNIGASFTKGTTGGRLGIATCKSE